MAITINIFFTGRNGNAKTFVKRMTQSKVVDQINTETGHIKYECLFPMDDPETVLLLDIWTDQSTIDEHHKL